MYLIHITSTKFVEKKIFHVPKWKWKWNIKDKKESKKSFLLQVFPLGLILANSKTKQSQLII